jgi:hypothetical protein
MLLSQTSGVSEATVQGEFSMKSLAEMEQELAAQKREVEGLLKKVADLRTEFQGEMQAIVERLPGSGTLGDEIRKEITERYQTFQARLAEIENAIEAITGVRRYRYVPEPGKPTPLWVYTVNALLANGPQTVKRLGELVTGAGYASRKGGDVCQALRYVITKPFIRKAGKDGESGLERYGLDEANLPPPGEKIDQGPQRQDDKPTPAGSHRTNARQGVGHAPLPKRARV